MRLGDKEVTVKFLNCCVESELTVVHMQMLRSFNLTLDEIVVDMKGGRFSPGQAYVAFSRVKTLQAY